MDFEQINEEDLIEMENMVTSPITDRDKQYVETINSLISIENKLDEVLRQLCHVTSSITNVITKLNLIDHRVLLQENHITEKFKTFDDKIILRE